MKNKPASTFFERMVNTVSVSASHSRRNMLGWKNRNFAILLMMLDLVEVFKDFYDPKDFVEFGSPVRFFHASSAKPGISGSLMFGLINMLFDSSRPL